MECDVRVSDVRLYFIPVRTRTPLKFGPETTRETTCARAAVTVRTRDGKTAEGWGETLLSVARTWPAELSYESRRRALLEFCRMLAAEWRDFSDFGHPLELGHAFLRGRLEAALTDFNVKRPVIEHMPWLAALACCSIFDTALHDAYGVALGVPTYETYNKTYMNHDLADFYDPEYRLLFAGRYPGDFLMKPGADELSAWHIVGGRDPLEASDLTGDEPDDGHPVLLADWIHRDGLRCLKIKLSGTDSGWDCGRIVRVGNIAVRHGADWLSADFSCAVHDPGYVTSILDRLLAEHPRIYGMLLFVEQPFPGDLEKHLLDVHAVSARKPLFLDESAYDWKNLALGRRLGWSGAALKTCKTQTGAILGLSWAKAHGMTLMVQDLANPMLAGIPHFQLAARAGTVMGVETSATQFYPDASLPEAEVHPGLYSRRCGKITLKSLRGPGFGYRIGEIGRVLPAPEAL
ncbi:MAG: mandelate racemase/muconate lactonizing enzyme family protein [Lentisphaerae bacterium]|nr:mandelate racemase/muconate lactonizing enzyme family protein [Lentisphaerota bacterium]